MVRSKRLVALLAVACLLSGAGCTALPPTDTGDGSTTHRLSGEVLVVDVANQAVAANASPSARADFENLTPAKQDEFLTALDQEVEGPEAWDTGTDVRYVRYEGTWYSVQVPIVN